MTRSEVLELLAEIDLANYTVTAYDGSGSGPVAEVWCDQCADRRTIFESGGGGSVMGLLEAIIQHEIASHP